MDRKKSFFCNALTLMTGTAIVQLIPLAISPVLTRMYTPEDFGLFAAFMSFVAVFGMIATGRYELAIMLPKKEKDALNVLALTTVLILFCSIIVTILMLSFDEQIASLLQNPNLRYCLYLVGIYIFFYSSFQAFTYWSNRKKQFQRLALAKVTVALVTGALSIIFGFFTALPFGLVIGALVGQGIGTLLYLTVILKEDHIRFRWITRSRMMRNASRFRNFPKLNLPHAFSDVLQANGIVFLISTFHGTSELGAYSLTMRVVQTPITLIGAAFAQVFYQKAVEVYRDDEDLQNFVKNLVRRLFFIGLPIFLGIFLVSPFLFGFLFGEEWKEAGIYAQILAPYMFIKFIVSPVSQLPSILDQQRTAFRYGVLFNFSIIVFVMAASAISHDMGTTITVMSCVGFFFTLGYGFLLFNMTRMKR